MSDNNTRIFDSKKLICEVKCRPIVWFPGDKRYKDRSARKTAWREIAEKFHLDWKIYSKKKKIETTEDLQKKWKHLRDYYLREKKTNVIGVVRKRNTPYIEMLTFLDDMIGYRDNVQKKQKSACPCGSNSNIFEDGSNNSSITHQEASSQPLPHQFEPNERKIHDKPDPDESFLMSLLPDIKTMNERAKFEFKFEMMSAIKRIKYSQPEVLKLEYNEQECEHMDVKIEHLDEDDQVDI